MGKDTEMDHTPPTDIVDSEETLNGRQRPSVVGIGASAGGLDPLRRFLASVPADSGMAFVVVMHLHPEHQSMLAEILGGETPIPVVQVQKDTTAAPDTVYVIAPNTALNIEGGVLKPAAFGPGQSRRNVIDGFFESLAVDQDSYAVGIVLSGSGSDGALGLRAIKAAAGLTLAQDPNTAEFNSMPRSAVMAGFVDHVLPVEEMPSRLGEHMRQLADLELGLKADPLDDGDKLRRLCAILREHTGHDFTYYKQNTLVRRLQRRLQVTRLHNLDAYIRRVLEDQEEAQLLLQELLIGVTQFFRDPDAFATLETEIVPAIFAGKNADNPVRIWVVGCSTGEEAYSLAILLAERRRWGASSVPISIFATDIDEQALEVARRGRYPQGVADQISPERLGRYFYRVGDSYQVVQEIREMCVFSTHNLLNDPPFTRLDLVSCRNVLIYLQPEAQRRVMPLLHYALRPGGYLFLGQSETASSYSNLFDGVREARYVFRRKDVESPRPMPFQVAQGSRNLPQAGQPDQTASDEVQRRRLGEVFRRTLLEEHAPAAVLINERGEILEASGQTRTYLQLPQGAFENNLFSMVQGSLRSELRRAFNEAMATRRTVTVEDVAFMSPLGLEYTRLLVRPAEHVLGSQTCLVVLTPYAPHPGEPDGKAGRDQSYPLEGSVQQLEEQLRHTSQQLQATIEEMETSNEELKSSNEELLSMNEELQSANEEHRAAQEELQSVNEELHTVNNELSRKIEELNRTRDDLENLLRSTDIATIFLDSNLEIKWFSPATQHIFPMAQSDLGRPVTDIAAPFGSQVWLDDIRAVTRDLIPRERELRLADDSAWYMMRVHPYRTRTNVIEGTVVTLVDITDLQRARLQSAELAAIVESSNDAIVSFRLDGTIISWNSGAQAPFGYTSAEMIGESFQDLFPLHRMAEYAEAQQRVLAGETPTPRFDTTLAAKSGNEIPVSLSLSPIRDSTGETYGFSAIMRDITERRRAEEALRRSEERLREVLSTDAVGVLSFNGEGVLTDANDAFLTMTGYTRSEVEAGDLDWRKMTPPEYVDASLAQLRQLEATGRLGPYEKEYYCRDGSRRWMLFSGAALDDGSIVEFCIDITEREELREADRRKEEFLSVLGHELRNPLAVIGALVATLDQARTRPPDLDFLDEALDILRRQSSHLSRLVDDMLDVTHISRGNLHVNLERLDLASIARGVFQDYRAAGEALGLTLEVDAPPEPVHVMGDQERLGQSLSNLLSNSFKFTPSGGKVSVRVGREDAATAMLVVQDTGVGAAPETLDGLFEPFGADVQTTTPEGSGMHLGLSLVKGIVEFHGGTVELSSQGPGTGFTVTIRLPTTE